MSFDLLARLRLTDEMSRPLRRATSGIVGFGAKITGVGAALTAMTAGISAVAVVSNSVKKAMDFEAELSTIQALTGATGKEMLDMQNLALKMGAATKYNALEAAQGIEELLKAGLTPATVQAGGLEAALNLATAGGLGLADAAEIMSTALNAYRDDNKGAAEMSNILAGTANASATGVMDLRYSLAAVSAVASGVGLSFEDTNIALGLFANNGLKGSDAGTSLKTMLMNLTPASKTAHEAMYDLGIITKKGTNAFYTAAGELQSMDVIAETLQKSLKKLNKQQQQSYLRDMFGQDAIRAGNILLKEGAKGVANFRKEMSKVTALDVATKKMDNAAGAVEQLQGAIETLQISALMPTMPLIKNFAMSAANYVEKYTPQITAGMQRMVDKATSYFNDPKFMNLPFAEKYEIAMADVKSTFDTWYANDGKEAIESGTQSLVNTLTRILGSDATISAVTDIGLSLGNSLLAGVTNGVVKGAKGSKVGKALLNFTPAGWVVQGASALLSKDDKKKGAQNISGGSSWDTAIDGSHRTGLDYVPRDGYIGKLHRGESVLPEEEANLYRKYGLLTVSPIKAESSSNKSGTGVVITGNTFNVRQESDIDAIAGQLYSLLRGAELAGSR